MTALDRIAVELAEHERVIERGFKTFVEVGSALADIRDAKLYRDGYATFEDYCEQRWSLSRKRAYDLMQGAATVEALSPMGDIPVPTSERQARELAGLPAENAAEVMRTAAEGGRITAATIRAAREAIAEPDDEDDLIEDDEDDLEEEPYDEDDEDEADDVIEHPQAAAARAIAEARNEPWAILTTKLHADLLAILRWIDEHGIDGLLDSRDAIAVVGASADQGIIDVLAYLGDRGSQIRDGIAARRGLRSVQ